MKQLLLGVGLALVLAGGARASDPTGIYARIEKVIFEPNDTKPERVQVWGTFALAAKRAVTGDEYQPPVKGYLYYSLVPGKEDKCRNEWTDLKKVAGKDQCVGFGGRYGQLGTVRKPDQKPKDPDAYPLARGVEKVDATNPQAKALKDKAKP